MLMFMVSFYLAATLISLIVFHHPIELLILLIPPLLMTAFEIRRVYHLKRQIRAHLDIMKNIMEMGDDMVKDKQERGDI